MSPRSIATNTKVDRAGLEEFLRTRHHIILMTTRRDSSPQAPPVTAGLDDQGRLVTSTYPERAKVGNARRNPAGAAVVLSDEWNGAWGQGGGTFGGVELP